MLKRQFFWLDVLLCIGLIGLAIWLGPRTFAWYAGLGLAAITLPLWILARLQLGAAFTLNAKAQHLVTHGLYAKIRHPVYLFGFLAVLGVLIALQFWSLLAVFLLLMPLQLLRIRQEDRTLQAAFGEEYERYRRSTWL